jgi:magnesium transporter
MARTRLYRNGVLEAEGFPVSEVSDRLARDDEAVVWFDLSAPSEAEFDTIRDELGLHSLAVEDALQAGQRPKLDHYPGHLFVTAYSLELDRPSGRLATHEVAMFITPRALVTVQPGGDFDIEQVLARWDSMAELAKSGVAFLLYGVLDYVVDTHVDVVQALDEEIDATEDEMFSDRASDTSVQRHNFTLRKSLVGIRKYLLPMTEVATALLRGDLHIADERMAPYFQDVYDHVRRATEQTDAMRDLLGTMLETRLSVRSNRLNVITKQVTSWAAIFAVPTAITGFYGQNVPYPGSEQHSGFLASTIIIVVVSISLYAVFRRKGWL